MVHGNIKCTRLALFSEGICGFLIWFKTNIHRDWLSKIRIVINDVSEGMGVSPI